jgi:hypothetical protein
MHLAEALKVEIAQSKPPRSCRRKEALHKFHPTFNHSPHRLASPRLQSFPSVLGVKLYHNTATTRLCYYFPLEPSIPQSWLQPQQLPVSASSQWARPFLNCKGPSVPDLLVPSTSVLLPVLVPVRSRLSRIAFQKPSAMRKMPLTVSRSMLTALQLEEICALKDLPCTSGYSQNI